VHKKLLLLLVATTLSTVILGSPEHTPAPNIKKNHQNEKKARSAVLSEIRRANLTRLDRQRQERRNGRIRLTFGDEPQR
jgi:hypothetical protein